MDSMEVPNFPI